MVAAKPSLYTLPFFLLCLSNFLFSASFSMIIPELPDYLASLGGKEYIGYTIALFTLAAGFSRPFSGKLTDHIGRIPIMAFGSLVCFICGGLYPMLHTVQGFLFLRFIHGMSTGTKPTATAAYVADVIPEDRRGEAQGSLGIFTATGMSIGPAIGSFLAAHYGLDQMFYISSIFALASIVILSRMKETLPKAMKSRFSFSLFRIGWKDVFEPKVVPVFWVMLFVSFSAGAMITLIPDTSKLVGWTNKGLYFTIYTISSILIRFFFSKASDQYGRIPVLIFGCFMLSLSMCLLVFSANSYLLIVSAIIYGMAWGVNTPTLAAWTNDLGDKNHMGRAMATMYIALEAGIGIGAYVSGEIYQGVASQIPIPFLLAALLSLLAFILLWTKKRNWTYGI
ncbi:MFS transporter [Aquirufa antheringensis]|uniref:MFS transporter n=1 Tax=Aquirufa antheringensis TaxID=2516559 RepID=UPI001032D061|nr:MFS transporter [Aquirufa antheringensis]TBH70060.1 MFS transporter [Aquirufa antheringensis]